jgi:hypothetical protein
MDLLGPGLLNYPGSPKYSLKNTRQSFIYRSLEKTEVGYFAAKCLGSERTKSKFGGLI